jgi:hypothetical protein
MRVLQLCGLAPTFRRTLSIRLQSSSHFTHNTHRCHKLCLELKVKLTLHRPGQAPGLQEFEAPRISRQSSHESGRVVSPNQRPPLAPGDIPGTNFRYRPSRPKGHNGAGRFKSTKKSMTLSWIELAAFRLTSITRCLNQLSHRVPANYVSCTQHFGELGKCFFSQDCRLVYWLYNNVVPTTKVYLDSIIFRKV